VAPCCWECGHAFLWVYGRVVAWWHTCSRVHSRKRSAPPACRHRSSTPLRTLAVERGGGVTPEIRRVLILYLRRKKKKVRPVADILGKCPQAQSALEPKAEASETGKSVGRRAAPSTSWFSSSSSEWMCSFTLLGSPPLTRSSNEEGYGVATLVRVLLYDSCHSQQTGDERGPVPCCYGILEVLSSSQKRKVPFHGRLCSSWTMAPWRLRLGVVLCSVLGAWCSAHHPTNTAGGNLGSCSCSFPSVERIH
jgi:hypothetical protein